MITKAVKIHLERETNDHPTVVQTFYSKSQRKSQGITKIRRVHPLGTMKNQLTERLFKHQ